MKILTLLGTRPELIRLSRIIPLLQQHCDHVLVHTGQSYDHGLSGIFLAELGYDPGPKYYLNARGSFGQQMAKIFEGMEDVLLAEKPDRVVVLGDTNSSLAVIVARRMGFKTIHLEAGNRSHNPESPEEINRKIIDHTSDLNLSYTERSRWNLLLEGIPIHHTLVVGNPIGEVMAHYGRPERFAEVAARLQIDGPFLLATAHRQESVDHPDRLKSIVDGLIACHNEFQCPVLFSAHPRTRDRLTALYGSAWPGEIRFLEPLGFLDFLALEEHARLILSDSGTVCEEAAILGVPCVILRTHTERPEVIELGSGMLSGVESESILRCARVLMAKQQAPRCPVGYMEPAVSEAVCEIVLGHLP